MKQHENTLCGVPNKSLSNSHYQSTHFYRRLLPSVLQHVHIYIYIISINIPHPHIWLVISIDCAWGITPPGLMAAGSQVFLSTTFWRNQRANVNKELSEIWGSNHKRRMNIWTSVLFCFFCWFLMSSMFSQDDLLFGGNIHCRFMSHFHRSWFESQWWLHAVSTIT